MLGNQSNNMTPEMQSYVANEVNNRMSNALNDLQTKYSLGLGGNDYSTNGPTGEAYKKEQIEKKRIKNEKLKQQQQNNEDNNNNNNNNNNNDDINEVEEGGDDDDYELRLLREKRLKEIRDQEIQRLENLAKGHGQYREITQDEFLTEVTSSFHVVCHFYHKEFPRCKIMDMHIRKLVERHVETKFISINAEKAPFFVEKLKIRTMPTLVLFEDGVAKNKIIGFEGLSDGMPEGHEDEWSTIKLARILGKNRMIDSNKIVDDDENQARAQATFEEMRKAAFVGFNDDDLNLDDSDEDI